MTRKARPAADLKPRRSLIEVLAPPAGYRFDAGIATTYGLDAVALTCALGALANVDVTDADADAASYAARPGDVLRAFTEVRDRLVLVRQGGQMRAAGLGRHHGLATLCDGMIRTVSPAKGSFHPKLWLVRYRASQGVTHRLVCTSRNLTGSQCLELAVAIDLEMRTRTSPFGEELARYLSAILREAGDVPRWASALASSARSLSVPERTFSRGAAVSLVCQTPKRGARGALDEALGGRGLRSITVLTPFLDLPWITRVAERAEALVVVSTRQALDEIAEGLDKVRTMDGKRRVSFRVARVASAAPQLHAKLVHVETGRDPLTIVGSANATSPAWGLRGVRNWECGVVWRPGLRQAELRAIAEDWTDTYVPRPLTKEERDELRDSRELDDIERDLARQLRLSARWRDGVLRLRAEPVALRRGFDAAIAPILTSGEPPASWFVPLRRDAAFACQADELTTMAAVRVWRQGEDVNGRPPLVVTLSPVSYPDGWRERRDQVVLNKVAEAAGGVAGVLWAILTNGAPPSGGAPPPLGGGRDGAPPGRPQANGGIATPEITLEQMLVAALDPSIAGTIDALLRRAVTDANDLRRLWAIAQGESGKT